MRRVTGPRKTHKHKGIFSGSKVRRFTGGSRLQGHVPRLIPEEFDTGFPDDPGSYKNPFMYHSFMCLFGASEPEKGNHSKGKSSSQARQARPEKRRC